MEISVFGERKVVKPLEPTEKSSEQDEIQNQTQPTFITGPESTLATSEGDKRSHLRAIAAYQEEPSGRHGEWLTLLGRYYFTHKSL